jgi:hypothetical protein
MLALVGPDEAEAAEVVGRAATSALGANARAMKGAAEGVMEGLVARTVTLCLAKENRPHAVSTDAMSTLPRLEWRVCVGGRGAAVPSQGVRSTLM